MTKYDHLSILQMRRLKYREAGRFAQGQTTLIGNICFILESVPFQWYPHLIMTLMSSPGYMIPQRISNFQETIVSE